jgi:predicted acetyltransferase
MRRLAVRVRDPAVTEVRPPTESERAEVANVMRVSLNFALAFVEERSSSLPLPDMRCVVEDGRVVATAGERRFTQWFGGRELAMSGIWGVATLPERRGTGLASAAVLDLLRGARDRGDALTALYPAVLQPYRRLGYALGGSYATHEVRIDDLPREPAASRAEPFDLDRDLDGIRECYRRAVVTHNGPIDSDDPWWWRDRILGHWQRDAIHQVAVVRGAEGIEGYISFVQEAHEGFLDVSFRLGCKHFVATTPEAYRALLSYARNFAGVGQALRFTGRPDDPLAHLVEVQRLTIESNYRWMLRLLDVAKALEGRGYPRVDGEVTLGVDDPHFEANRGPWRIAASEGRVTVDPSDRADATVDVRALSAMYTGFLAPSDAVRLGWLERDEGVVSFLTDLFRGPAPFMLDFF